MRVLVADDDQSVQRLVQGQLERGGYEVVLASDGDAAWAALRANDIRLAVLDWDMPGIDGVEICRRLQGMKSAIYVIILTATSDPASVTIALDAGASDFISKPCVADVLRARVNVGARIIKIQSRLAHAQKLESIGQLAAGIAHEINTPIQYVGDNARFLQESMHDLMRILDWYAELLDLNPQLPGWDRRTAEIRSALEALDIEFLKEEIPKAIGQSLEGAERVARIVRAMKDFSHPGGDDKEAVDLSKAIDSTITVGRNEWKYVAEMVTDFDPDLPPVPCLVGEFNQVVLNLVINAAHAITDAVSEAPGAKGTITITTRRVGGWAEIRVGDTGTGIPEAYRAKVFDHFFTTKEIGRGTGQGLAIAYGVITEKHGGTITLESEMGKGTTFIIRLPIEVKTAPAEETPQREATCPTGCP